MDRLKKFFINGILMTSVTLLCRYVAVGFNVYLTNKIGAVAMGVFTLISSVYGFALTLATSGISLATTRLVSEALGIGRVRREFSADSTISAIMKKSLGFSALISTLTALLLLLLSKPIGVHLLGDARTVSSLRVLALSLPPIALSSSLSGYFSALRKVHKNAAVQILSVALRISISVMLLSAVLANDIESACLSVVGGIALSELICFLFHLLVFLLERKRNPSDKNGAVYSVLPRRLLSITIPVAFSACVRSALVTLEHLLIPRGLERSGASRAHSLAAYGTLHSVVFPLVLFPSAISSSFAGLLVPEISESGAAGDAARIERIVGRVLKTVLLYSIGVSGIMMCLSCEMGDVLLSNTESALYILAVAPLVPVMYLDTSVDSILKGLGYQFYTMIVNIVDASLSVILVLILLPRFGIMGYIMTVYFTETVNATLSVTKLLIVTKIRVRIFDWIVKPLASVILATHLGAALLSCFGSYASGRLGIALHVLLLTALYFVFLLITRALSLKKLSRSLCGFIK